MDPVTTALLTAISSGLNNLATEAAKDAFKAVKDAVKRKLGISKAIEDLEAAPDSKKRQTQLAQALSAQNASKDPELIKLAQRLIEAIKETEAGGKSMGKYNIQASGAQVGVIGDGIRIEGGLHFHNYGGPGAGAAQGNPSVDEAATPQVDEQNQVPMHMLHLSDLHFGTKEDAQRWHGQLTSDLKQELSCDRIDAIIISGDVANLAAQEEYAAARIFIERMCKTFQVDRSNLVIVPGNHDLDWKRSKKGYSLKYKEELDKGVDEEDYIVVNEEIVQLRDVSAHQERFKPFSDFYQEIKGTPYPLDYAQQGIICHLKDLDILVLGLNSAWQVDHHFRAKAGICPDAVASTLDTILKTKIYADCTKFAVWHHPISSACDDRITDHGFLELLAQNGFSVGFHGHLHKTTSNLFRYDHSAGGRKIEIVGAGTFGAPTRQWYPGYPLQYNLLEISPKQMTVRTRCRKETNGAWEPHAIWRQGPGQDPKSSYTIDLPQRPPKKPKPQKPIKGKTTLPPSHKIDTESIPNIETHIEDYCRSAASFHEYLPLMGFRTKLRVPIRIEDIYVPLRAMVDLRATGEACFADAEDAEKKLTGRAGECGEITLPDAFKEAEEKGRRGIVILGDPGSGKTTHLKRVLLWCLQGGYKQLGLSGEMLPVFLPLRELTDLSSGLDAFIQDQLDKPHLNTPAGFGTRLLGRGRLLFLLDGLDEVADADQRAKVSRWINDALKAHATCRFVVTSRFAGYTEKARLSEQFLEMHIRPLDFEQVKAFVQNWYRIVETGLSRDSRQARVIADERSQKLIELLKSPEFRARRVFELTRNPLLLANICLVHRDRGNLPTTRVGLYEDCTEVLLELWRAAIGYETKVNARSGKKVLQPAALWLHSKQGRTRATGDELAPVIEPALKAAGWPHGKAEDFLKVVRDESGLLTGWDQETYGFMHLGFQEYLAARQIQNDFYRNPSMLNELAERFGQSWWQEVILLLLALDNPCLFEPFMQALVQKSAFTQHPELVEMCLDDAAERPLRPFLSLLQADAGKDPEHWQRQLAALQIVERLDNSGLNDLIPQLAQHPFDQIRERVDQRKDRAEQKVILAPRGGYELVWIPGGEFLMGSPEDEKGRFNDERPQRRVQIAGFYMGRYPVTNEEYARFLAENPKAPEPKYWAERKYNQPRQPVVGVSWQEARQYALWAGLQLPSEAQWEYACRTGTKTRYHSGDTEKDLDRVGWYDKNSDDKLRPVGQKDPNGFGLYDMHGNVSEWVEDDYHYDFSYYLRAPDDGTAWIDEPRGWSRVARGGGWFSPARNCRSACRIRFAQGSRTYYLGFRLILIEH